MSLFLFPTAFFSSSLGMLAKIHFSCRKGKRLPPSRQVFAECSLTELTVMKLKSNTSKTSCSNHLNKPNFRQTPGTSPLAQRKGQETAKPGNPARQNSSTGPPPPWARRRSRRCAPAAPAGPRSRPGRRGRSRLGSRCGPTC